MTDLMVEATSVTKDYKISRGLFRGKEVLRAVDKVSISVNRGETLAVVGESGCGKTTLANMLMKFLNDNKDWRLYEHYMLGKCGHATIKRK